MRPPLRSDEFSRIGGTFTTQPLPVLQKGSTPAARAEILSEHRTAQSIARSESMTQKLRVRTVGMGIQLTIKPQGHISGASWYRTWRETNA